MAIVLCLDIGCVALALSHSSPFSLAERRRRRRDAFLQVQRRQNQAPASTTSSSSVLHRSPSFTRHWRPQYPPLDLRTLVLWTCGWFSATAGGGEGARFPALAPTKTARKRGRDRGKLAAIVLCFDVGCVALAHSNSSPLSLAERRRRDAFLQVGRHQNQAPTSTTAPSIVLPRHWRPLPRRAPLPDHGRRFSVVWRFPARADGGRRTARGDPLSR